MKRFYCFVALSIPLLFCAPVLPGAEKSAPLDIRLTLPPANPEHPVMGDHLHFQSMIRNIGSKPVEGLTAWIDLVEVDPGHEQPMDLEDWSAHKAVTHTALRPGEGLNTDWPMRLIRAGVYRVVVCVAFRNRRQVVTSPTVEFEVAHKPVIESIRILPIAFGVPFLIGCLMMIRRFWTLRVSETMNEYLLLFIALWHVLRFQFSERFLVK